MARTPRAPPASACGRSECPGATARRHLRRERGEACLRRGAAAHPPLPLEALYSPPGRRGDVTCARVGAMPATCSHEELSLGRCERSPLRPAGKE